MKRKIFCIFLFINCLLFADEKFKGLYNFKKLPVNEVQVGYGFLEPQYIEGTNYTDCWMFGTENIKGVNSFFFLHGDGMI